MPHRAFTMLLDDGPNLREGVEELFGQIPKDLRRNLPGTQLITVSGSVVPGPSTVSNAES
jgi:hypothetical protein